MSDPQRFPVVEIFGPTIQGEGILAGKPTYFVRFGGCDYRCVWCDTDQAVLPVNIRANARKLTVNDIVVRVLELPRGSQWVTLSGGNPALLELGDLRRALVNAGFKVAVETQGSVWKNWLADVDCLTISPKPPSAKTQKPEAFAKFMQEVRSKIHPAVSRYSQFDVAPSQSVVLKVPIWDRTDFEWARYIHLSYTDIPFYLSVVSAMGGLYGTFDGGRVDTTQDILDRYEMILNWTTYDLAMRDATVLPQLHALVWGFERGH